MPSPPSAPIEPMWHALKDTELFDRTVTEPHGLTQAEASARLERFGHNELALSAAPPWWKTLIKQFLSPIVGILTVAAVITLLQEHWVDAIAIILILCINAALGFVQERKAESDVRALQSLTTPRCRVLRDGREHVVDTRDVVPGDVVLLETGERVPADLRLVAANNLQVDESMLTGESYAVTKQGDPLPVNIPPTEATNLAFAGTFVASGRGKGVVVATGGDTSLGQINALVQGPKTVTPLEKLTHRLERRIGLIVLASVVFVFLAGLALGNDVSTMFRTVVGLAVATIPESLPIVLTVAMSFGVSRMARRNAIIRTLPSVETLGSTTVIGSDKTGTLTENRLTVERLWTADGETDLTSDAAPTAPGPVERLALRTGALTNEATVSSADPTSYTGDAVDAAMARVAVLAGAVTEPERASGTLAQQPYEPELRCSQTARRDESGRRWLYVKGSPETLLAASDTMATSQGDVPIDPELVLAANESFGRDGLRVMATAYRELRADEEPEVAIAGPLAGLTFLGLEGLTDPPREGVRDAIEACRRAGMKVIMITGDHPVTAMAIADRLGMDTSKPALTGAEMASLDDDLLAARLGQTSVAARVSPQDKLRIVESFRGAGHVIAVTGDGVNDAPALKAASIGVAMGRSGTDVAREASDVVLTDDNFVTIVSAVKEGRVTFSAIRKSTYFLLSTGAAALVAVALSVFAGLPLLFLPVQLLWINVVTNGVQDIALAYEPGEGDELNRPPRDKREGLLSRTLWFRAGITGLWMALWVLSAFIIAERLGYDLDRARSLALTMFVMFNFFQVFSSRAEYKSLFQLRLLNNKPLLFTSLGALAVHWGMMAWPVSAGILGVVPISALEWLVCVAAGSTVLIIVEAEKAVRRISRRRRLAASAPTLPQPR